MSTVIRDGDLVEVKLSRGHKNGPATITGEAVPVPNNPGYFTIKGQNKFRYMNRYRDPNWRNKVYVLK